MEIIHKLAFQTILIRSQISEALCLYASEFGSSESILNAAERSSDVIEHIAQYALEGVNHDMQANLLVQDLTTALFLISEFERELKQSRKNVPNANDINVLISEIRELFKIALKQDAWK
ncbi:hypothetical protein [Hafnia paralvei]|uniref:hypothetical protein n=1 Tax=Hafnia paralvei TaxID=546367 RepID=UPI0007E4CD8E|nr:hypothetical protein [Hafnia paralvei]